MSKDIESRLRASLRPVAPGDDFARGLVERITANQTPQPVDQGAGGRRHSAPAWWVAASLAASLLVAVGVQHHLQQQRERGMEARRQVIEALRVTSQKLDLAYETIKGAS
jgi:hypothetical protein